MESMPKMTFNNKVVGSERDYSEQKTMNSNQDPLSRILELIKEANPNGLRKYLESLGNASHYLNLTNSILNQTPIYQAVQIKNKTVGYSITDTLLKQGVNFNNS